MYTEFTLKLKALTLAVMINGLIMGGAAFLFDGQIHGYQQNSAAQFADHAVTGVTSVHASVFRP